MNSYCGRTCPNCKKLVFGECPICNDEMTCKVDGCSNKQYRQWICKEHYERQLNESTGDKPYPSSIKNNKGINKYSAR